jgi:hypothetical protein
MRFFLILSVWITGLFFNGCSGVKLYNKGIVKSKEKVFSCQERAKPKSLQFLEQQYRCKSEE